jgi:hypothetical protein
MAHFQDKRRQMQDDYQGKPGGLPSNAAHQRLFAVRTGTPDKYTPLRSEPATGVSPSDRCRSHG